MDEEKLLITVGELIITEIDETEDIKYSAEKPNTLTALFKGERVFEIRVRNVATEKAGKSNRDGWELVE